MVDLLKVMSEGFSGYRRTQENESRVKADVAKEGLSFAKDVFTAVNPEPLLKYVTGTDATLGQNRSWSHIGEDMHFTAEDNPFSRMAHVGYTIALGGADMALGHLPNLIFNEGLGLNVSYFRPVPATLREAAVEVASMAVITGMPAALKAAGVTPKAAPALYEPAYKVTRWESFKEDLAAPAKAVKEALQNAEDAINTRLAAQGRVAFDSGFVGDVTPPPFLDLINQGNLSNFIRYAARNADAARALLTYAEKNIQSFTAEHLPALTYASKTCHEAVTVLKNLAKAKPELRPQIIDILANSSIQLTAAAEALAFLIDFDPTLAPMIVPAMMRAASWNRFVCAPLLSVLKRHPELVTVDHLPGLLELARFNKEIAGLLQDKALADPTLAPKIIQGFVESITTDPNTFLPGFIAVSQGLYAFVTTALETFRFTRKDFVGKMLPSLIERAKADRNAAIGVRVIAEAMPEIFTSEHIPGLSEAAKVFGEAGWALERIASANRELRPQIIPGFIEAAGSNDYSAHALRKYAENEPRSFGARHLPSLVDAAMTNGDVAWAIHSIVRARRKWLPRLMEGIIHLAQFKIEAVNTLRNYVMSDTGAFQPQHIPALINASVKSPLVVLVIDSLAAMRPDMFTPEHRALLQEALKFRSELQIVIDTLASVD